MSKRRKSTVDLLFQENVAKPQQHERTSPQDKQFVRIFNSMLDNKNYMALSGSAVKLFQYMKQWAIKNKEYKTYGTFDYSTGLLESEGIMAKKTCAMALKELEHYGFIKKMNNATSGCGFAQKWAFSDEWQKGDKPVFDRHTRW